MKKENIFKIIIFSVVLLIPVIYSFFYLKSYWNPYGDLTGLKIAVVNLDEGIDGENQGTEFIQGLKDSATFGICETTLDEANNGMQSNEYYAMILVPSNFTECLNSAGEKDKQIATITYSPNQASNYLASQIINSAVKTMELNLQSKIDSEITDTLAGKLEDVSDSLGEISDGAGQILEGSTNLNSGLNELNKGTTKLNNGYTDYDNGIKSAYQGSKALDNGINQINQGISALNSEGTDGIKSLVEGFGSLSTGAKQVSDGVSNVSNSLVNKISTSQSAVLAQAGASSIEQVDGMISSYSSKIPTLVTCMNQYGADTVDPTSASNQTFKQEYDAVISGIASLNQVKGAYSSLETVKQSINESGTSGDLYKLSVGAKQLSDGINTLSSEETTSKLNKLTEGIKALEEGTSKIKEGSSSLKNGLSKLDVSSTEIKNGLNTLNEGTNSAYNGSTELVNGVQTFSDKINEGIEDSNAQLEKLDGIDEFAENSVDFKTESYGNVDSYGIAFTPLFLSIGLWVGALMCYVVLYYDQKNRFNIFGSESKNKILQNTLYIIIGAFEGLLTGFLLKVGLGYGVESVAVYYGACTLIGITFMSIVQFLIRNFGDIGKFIALIILVLQLAASGGTFPVETIDKAFQGLTNYLPMTYSIKLLKEILVPTVTNYKNQYMLILALITVFTFAITCVVDVLKNKKQVVK